MAHAACIRFLRDYVATPSVNPMGRVDIPAEIAGERRYAEHLREQLRGLGLDAELIGRGDRTSVVARADAVGSADTLMVASHLDTVPVDGMEIEPFDPRIEGNHLYGRGSCDTKGGMAALVAALERVLARGTLRRNLLLIGEADEELASVGVADVLEHLGAARPDWTIATEPTELRVATAHKGVAHAHLVADGRACHASNPALGRNAIVAMSRAVMALDGVATELARHEDPRLGPATLSVGVIGGGHAPNIVPDKAWLVVDRRLLPGESVDDLRREIEAALTEHAADAVRIARCELMKAPLSLADDHPAVRTCSAALEAQGLPAAPVAVAFGTDAGIFAENGIPGVVMGPGSIAQAHTAREFVEVTQVEAMVEIFVKLLEARS